MGTTGNKIIVKASLCLAGMPRQKGKSYEVEVFALTDPGIIYTYNYLSVVYLAIMVENVQAEF